MNDSLKKNIKGVCEQRTLFLVRKHSLKKAFSLVEIMVIVGLIAALFAALSPQLLGPSSAEKTMQLSRVQSDIRSAYDMAVLNNKYYRLVFDLMQGDYWLEVTEAEEIYVGNANGDRDLTAEGEQNLADEFDSEFEVYESLAAQPVKHPDPDRDDEEISLESPLIQAKESLRNLRTPKWRKVENIEWSKREIGPSMLFRGIQTEHHDEYQNLEDMEEGARAMLYFYPSGYVEHAVIHIAHRKGDSFDPDRSMYTVLTHAYAGYATMEPGMIEVDLEAKIEGEE